MTDDSESVALRPTVIDGQRQEDNYEVIWRGLPIGRIMKPPGEPHWWWGCNVYGQPQEANDRGQGINFKDCQLRFKIAWTRIRAGLTEEDISVAVQHAQTLAEQQSLNVDAQPKPEELRNLENSRAAPRQRVFKAGTIEFGGSTIDCVVRNISATGAALEDASPVGIPAEFNLLISGNIVHAGWSGLKTGALALRSGQPSSLRTYCAPARPPASEAGGGSVDALDLSARIKG